MKGGTYFVFDGAGTVSPLILACLPALANAVAYTRDPKSRLSNVERSVTVSSGLRRDKAHGEANNRRIVGDVVAVASFQIMRHPQI